MDKGWGNATDEEVAAYKRYDFFSWLTNGALTCPLVLLGTAGNIYSIILMRRNKKLRDTVALHLCTLAGWDAALLVATFLYYGLASLFVDLIQPWLAYKYIAWVLHPVITLTMTASIWMVVLITSERHMSIWRPLSFRTRDTILRARVIVCLIGTFAVVINAPTVLELEIIECSERNGTMGTELAPTTLRYHMLYNTLYRVLCYFLFITVCPFTLILVLTVRMIYLLRKAQADCLMKLMSQTTAIDTSVTRRRRKSEMAVTKMLLGITIKFLLCYSLPTSLNIWETSNFLNGQEPSLTFRYCVDISNLLVIINSASNSLIVIRFHRKSKPEPPEPSGREMHREFWWLTKAIFTRSSRKRSHRFPATELVNGPDQPDPNNTQHSSDQDSTPFVPFDMNTRQSTNRHSNTTARSMRGSSGKHRPSTSTLSDPASLARWRRNTAAETKHPPHFSPEEARVLGETWAGMKRAGIGLRIVASLLRSSPDSQRWLSPVEMDVATPTPTLDDPARALLSNDNGSLAERSGSAEAVALEGLLEEVVGSAGVAEEEDGVAERLRALGPFHARHGISLQNRHWRVFKTVLVETAGEGADAELAVPAWNRLACFAIAKVKSGLH